MKTYLVRSGKYAIYLIVLLFVLFAIMNAVQPQSGVFSALFSSTRGLYMAVVIVVFAAIYPMMGYIKRTLTFDATTHIDEVVNVMSLCGYTRTDRGENGSMEFRANSKMKRLSMMYEDCITIVTVDGISTIAGPRKEVVRSSFRFNTFIG